MMFRQTMFIGICCFSFLVHAKTFTYQPAPVDNPLKGVVPYVQQQPRGRFPHSMEFSYLPMRDIMARTTEPDQPARYTYNWTPLEQLLETTADRGCQLIFRMYLEFPGKPLAVPQFLIDDGVTVTEWTHPKENKTNFTPDYENPHLRKAIKAFIAEMGSRYDGDPRIGYITAGILGKWGEWHDWPQDELFASPKVQQEVLQAYAKAFKKTKILLRYPSSGDDDHAANDTAPFGYHDDSFAWATLETSRPSDSWFYMALLKAAGPAAMNKWKTHPIGGEIRPELWPTIFTDQPHQKQQDFDQCVQATHVTWLMDTGLSSPRYPLPERRVERAVREIRKMGYELHLSRADSQPNKNTIEITLTLENRGVAPFYYDWPVEMALLDDNNRPVKTWTPDWQLTTILPQQPVTWKTTSPELPAEALPALRPAIRIPNPMPTGKPLRLANQYPQDTDYLPLQ